MSDDEPTRRRIATEVVVYALLFVVVGALFALARWMRDPEAFARDPRASQRPPASGR